MSAPGAYNFRVPRGKTFTLSFRKLAGSPAVAVDLTGWKARGQIRTEAGQFGNTTTTTLLLDMTDGAELEITDPDGGLIVLNLSVAQTIAICPANVRTTLSYEIELYNDNVSPETVEGLVAGKITVTPETAR